MERGKNEDHLLRNGNISCLPCSTLDGVGGCGATKEVNAIGVRDFHGTDFFRTLLINLIASGLNYTVFTF